MAKRPAPLKPPKRPKPTPPDVGVWIPRRETAELLQVAYSTMATWAGPRFRMKQAKAHNGTVRWYCHRDDVERVRLERLGPRLWEIERYVLDALIQGKSAGAIIQGQTHITLADVERIRDLDAKLSSACVLHGAAVRELRQLLDVETMTADMLLLHVRSLVERVERLALVRSQRRSEPPKSSNGE